MLGRVAAIALNTYREAVRARVLVALLALALGTSVFSVLVATLSLHNETRVVANIGAGSVSIYAVAVAIVLGATSLYRELEHKTIFPILARPIRRHEYLVGKYLGTMLTLVVFVAIAGGVVLGLLALEGGAKPATVFSVGALFVAILGVSWIRARFTRVYVIVPWAMAFFAGMALIAAPAGAERQLVLLSALLTVLETTVVASVAVLFSSFSSPFLTATFTFAVFVVGRSCDTLAHLPERSYGHAMHVFGVVLSRVFPNLQAYVPARTLLLGEMLGLSLPAYVTSAAGHALCYALVLLTVSALAFRARDFA